MTVLVPSNPSDDNVLNQLMILKNYFTSLSYFLVDTLIMFPGGGGCTSQFTVE